MTRASADEPHLPVDRCVCIDVTFSRMKAHVDRHGGDLESLRAAFGCGRACAMCVPYVRAMLATGRVRFEVDDPAVRAAAPPNQDGPPRPL
jgi:bacterioferritin-associated ferredoxin